MRYIIYLALYAIISFGRDICTSKSSPAISEMCEYDECYNRPATVAGCTKWRRLIALNPLCIGSQPCYLRSDGGISNTDTHKDPRRERIYMPPKSQLEERLKDPLDPSCPNDQTCS